VAASPVTEPSEDVSLVEAARQGDRAAFARLYDRYARMVHAVLLARVPYGEVADLVQDVFLIALGKLPRLRDPRAVGGWLAAIARHRATDFHRRSHAVEVTELPEELRGAEASTTAADAEAAAALEMVRSLPEAYRETLLMRLVEGMTGAEIAARTGLTPASVRVNLHRGMKMLRQMMGKEAGA